MICRGLYKMADELQFQDADSYSTNYNKNLTFKDIVLQHIKKIGSYASVEFRGGYWEIRETPIVSGNVGGVVKSKVYVPDTREVYSNSVEYLADILYPHFDKEMIDKEIKLREELSKIYQDKTVLIEGTRTEQDDLDSRKFSKIEDKILYRDQRVLINRRLFRDLCSFLYRIKYLEIGNLTD